MRNKTLSLMFLILMGLFIVQSCGDSSDEVKEPLSNYSGEEIFKALYFLQGDAANNIQAIQGKAQQYRTAVQANEDIKKLSEEFSSEIIAKIKELDPTYFNKFKEQLSSGNYYSMEMALTNGAKMLKAAGYRSTYGGVFRLVDALNEKQVDFSAEELKGLDFSKKEDAEKLKTFLMEEYAINLDDEDYKVACIPVVGVCVVYAVGAVVSIGAVVYTAAAVVNAAAWVTVYAWVELWGGNAMMQTVGQNEVLIEELSRLL